MTLPLAVLFASPALFPGHSPVAVWIGVGSLALAAWLTWKADEMGGSETTLRAWEAADWLAAMCERRVG